jgi:hypothetical protein
MAVNNIDEILEGLRFARNPFPPDLDMDHLFEMGVFE